ATGSLLVVSRIDPASRRETVVAFNSGGGPLSTRIRTATPSSAWTRELGNSPTRSDARGDLTVRVDALAAVVMTADAPIPAAAPPRPTVVVLPDDQSTLWTVNARVPASAPASVAVAGSLQSELGCPGDWQADCALTHLVYDASDDVWQRSFTVPAGSWEYKAPLNDTWDENYGLPAQLNGPNIPLDLAAAT